MLRPRLLCLLCAVLAGCALGPGDPFATLSPSLQADYRIPADRQLPGDFAQLASDYQVRVSALTLEVSLAELRALSGGGGGGGGSFDPANPPPGYSLCHGGHCHRDDGALIPYAEIEAELLFGGPAQKARVVAFPVGRAMDALAGTRLELGCEPSCDLGQVSVTEARVGLGALRVEGTVRDGRPSARFPGAVAFSLELQTEPFSGQLGSALVAPLELTADRQSPPKVELSLRLALSPRIFDSIDFAELERDQDAIRMDADQNLAARTAALERFGQATLEVEVSRSR